MWCEWSNWTICFHSQPFRINHSPLCTSQIIVPFWPRFMHRHWSAHNLDRNCRTNGTRTVLALCVTVAVVQKHVAHVEPRLIRHLQSKLFRPWNHVRANIHEISAHINPLPAASQSDVCCVSRSIKGSQNTETRNDDGNGSAKWRPSYSIIRAA